MPAPKSALASGVRVYLRRPQFSDAKTFITAVAGSRRLHGRWVQAPATTVRFDAYVKRFAGSRSRKLETATHVGLFACRSEDHALVGVFNLSDIVHGNFRCAYLGYYAFTPNAGRGYMSEGLDLAFDVAFRTLHLHRVEVNIQPANARSSMLVRRAGLTREGFSRRYMKLAGRWRDHERWALLVEDWKAQRRRTRRR
jgi:[ribosomal protein S5]-alanine N-acetyltransferase